MTENIPTRIERIREDTPPVGRLRPYLEKFGYRCASYATLQPQMTYYLWESVGYGAAVELSSRFRGTHLVLLSNPVTAIKNQVKFLKHLAREKKKITLVQIDERLASELYKAKFKVYQIGIETELDIQNFDLKGKKKASLRQWRNKALREGVKVEEKLISNVLQHEIQDVCSCWLKHKGEKELSFLTRPFPNADEQQVRFFWAKQNGKLIGFAGFDPIFSDGKIIGYYHNFDRITGEAPNGTPAFLLMEALEQFRQEGRQVLSLGLSPLSGMEKGYDLSGILKKISELFYSYGEKLYPFKGNEQHKSKFNGDKKKVYVASNAGWFDTMIAAATACGLELK